MQVICSNVGEFNDNSNQHDFLPSFREIKHNFNKQIINTILNNESLPITSVVYTTDLRLRFIFKLKGYSDGVVVYRFVSFNTLSN